MVGAIALCLETDFCYHLFWNKVPCFRAAEKGSYSTGERVQLLYADTPKPFHEFFFLLLRNCTEFSKLLDSSCSLEVTPGTATYHSGLKTLWPVSSNIVRKLIKFFSGNFISVSKNQLIKIGENYFDIFIF